MGRGPQPGPEGMMNILLTPEWIRETGINAEAEWQKRGQHDGRHSHADFLAEFAARAVLRKAVEWLKQNNCAALQADGTRTYAAHLVLPKESWQALKQAAVEGK